MDAGTEHWQRDRVNTVEPAPGSVGVRLAKISDAGEAAAVLRASISTLCVEDHGDEPDVIARWVDNKTAENVRNWIEGSGCVVVAEENGQIVGVGAASVCGDITLNYVLPEARFRGVSKAMLDALETYLRDAGHARSRTSSTRTAHRFYQGMGYVDAGEPLTWGRFTTFPMEKELSGGNPPACVGPADR